MSAKMTTSLAEWFIYKLQYDVATPRLDHSLHGMVGFIAASPLSDATIRGAFSMRVVSDSNSIVSSRITRHTVCRPVGAIHTKGNAGNAIYIISITLWPSQTHC